VLPLCTAGLDFGLCRVVSYSRILASRILRLRTINNHGVEERIDITPPPTPPRPLASQVLGVLHDRHVRDGRQRRDGRGRA
jgi:hypothetical protein